MDSDDRCNQSILDAYKDAYVRWSKAEDDERVAERKTAKRSSKKSK